MKNAINQNNRRVVVRVDGFPFVYDVNFRQEDLVAIYAARNKAITLEDLLSKIVPYASSCKRQDVAAVLSVRKDFSDS